MGLAFHYPENIISCSFQGFWILVAKFTIRDKLCVVNGKGSSISVDFLLRCSNGSNSLHCSYMCRFVKMYCKALGMSHVYQLVPFVI